MLQISPDLYFLPSESITNFSLLFDIPVILRERIWLSFTMYESCFFLLISYIFSLPLAQETTVLGWLSHPMTLSPGFISCTSFSDPSHINILVPFAKHLPMP